MARKDQTDELFDAFTRFRIASVLNTLKSGRAVSWLGHSWDGEQKVVLHEVGIIPPESDAPERWIARELEGWGRIREANRGNRSTLIVRDFVEGTPFNRVLSQNPKPTEAEARLLFAAIADRLALLHDLGEPHAAIKPSNIIIQPEAIALVDPRLGPPLADATPDATREFVLWGDLRYMCPEMLLQQPLTQESDIYCLGTILYQFLAGRPPFQSDNPILTGYAHLREEPVGIRILRTDLSRDTEEVLRQMLEKNRGDRFPDAKALAARLREGIEPAARAIPEWIHDLGAPDAPKRIEIVELDELPKASDPSETPADQPGLPALLPLEGRPRGDSLTMISLRELQRALDVAKKNPEASLDDIRKYIDADKIRPGDHERIPPLFQPESYKGRKATEEWKAAPRQGQRAAAPKPPAPATVPKQVVDIPTRAEIKAFQTQHKTTEPETMSPVAAVIGLAQGKIKSSSGETKKVNDAAPNGPGIEPPKPPTFMTGARPDDRVFFGVIGGLLLLIIFLLFKLVENLAR